MHDQEHWTKKGDVNLFLSEKRTRFSDKLGTILFVHGSSMASQPIFEVRVPGVPDSSAMDCPRSPDPGDVERVSNDQAD